MTTLVDLQKTCYVCGNMGNYTGIGSTNTFCGTPDLDTRPPEMERSTISFWVQRCEVCGYCADDISTGTSGVVDLPKTQEYNDLLEGGSLSDLAATFLCSAMLQEAAGDQTGAGWAALHAAWVCDDAYDRPSADRCRAEALRHFNSARLAGESIADDKGIEDAIIADLLRRSGQFDETLEHCGDSLSRPCEPIIDGMLRFQIALAQRKDANCYTIAAAREFAEERSH